MEYMLQHKILETMQTLGKADVSLYFVSRISVNRFSLGHFLNGEIYQHCSTTVIIFRMTKIQ